eukprot:2533431-Prymnesium_polylepis.1
MTPPLEVAPAAVEFSMVLPFVTTRLTLIAHIAPPKAAGALANDSIRELPFVSTVMPSSTQIAPPSAAFESTM